MIAIGTTLSSWRRATMCAAPASGESAITPLSNNAIAKVFGVTLRVDGEACVPGLFNGMAIHVVGRAVEVIERSPAVSVSRAH
jgi:hypothetical protein